VVLVANPKTYFSETVLLIKDEIGFLTSEITGDECTFFAFGGMLLIVHGFL